MRFFQKIKNWKTVRGWHIWKLKLVDARLYFVSMIVGLLTGLIAVCYHYLLYFLLHIRSDFFASRPAWYWHILLFLLFWGILMFVSFLVGRMPLISGGGIPQTRGVINGRITYKHPFVELVSKFAGGILSVAAGLSLGREGPSVQIGSYIGSLVSRWTHILQGERKQLLAAGASTARFIFLLFVAPALCGMIAWRHRHHSEISKYHCTILHAALGYLLGEAVLIGAVSLFIIGELAYMALIG